MRCPLGHFRVKKNSHRGFKVQKIHDLLNLALGELRTPITLSVKGGSGNPKDFTQLGTGACDLIVSNPPYITLADMQTLSPQVRHEPELALYGGEDGLRFYRQLTQSCYDHLRPGGWLIFEIGYDQGESVPALLRQRGFTEVFCQTDLAGVPRCAGGRRPLQEGSE